MVVIVVVAPGGGNLGALIKQRIVRLVYIAFRKRLLHSARNGALSWRTTTL